MLANNESAIDVYKRVAFFDTTNQYPQVFNRISEYYEKLNNFDLAISYIDSAISHLKIDSLKNELLFKKIELLILNSNFNYAEIVLNELKVMSEIQKKRKYFYYAVTDFKLGKMDESKELFTACIEDSLEKAKVEIDKLFIDIKRNEAKNSKMPAVMSFLFPGLGQFYSGDIKNGTNSLLLNASLIALSIIVAYNYTLFDAVISVVPWWFRYYKGGIYHAEKIAESKKLKTRNLLYNQVLDVVSNTK